MNLTGNGYNVGTDFYRDEQLASQFPNGRLPDTPNPIQGNEYVPCVLPCPNPQCPYSGWVRTGEFTIGAPGLDCQAFLETLLRQTEAFIEPPDLQPKPTPRTLTTRV